MGIAVISYTIHDIKVNIKIPLKKDILSRRNCIYLSPQKQFKLNFFIGHLGWSWIFKVLRESKNKWSYERRSNRRSGGKNGHRGRKIEKNVILIHFCFLYGYHLCINKFQIAQAEAELQRMEAKLKNETGVAKAQRDFDIKKGIVSNGIFKLDFCWEE